MKMENYFIILHVDCISNYNHITTGLNQNIKSLKYEEIQRTFLFLHLIIECLLLDVVGSITQQAMRKN